MEPWPKNWDAGLLAEQSDAVCLSVYKLKMGQSWPLHILNSSNVNKVNALEMDYKVPLITLGKKVTVFTNRPN